MTNSFKTQADAAGPSKDSWGPFLILVAFAGIVALTLFPFQILPRETALHRQPPFLHWYFEKPFEFKDWLLNVVLFVPFGFGLGVALHRRFSWRTALLIATAASFAFTFTVETIQLFMPTRTSSWYDVSANTAGGMLGFAVSLIAGNWAERRVSSGRDCVARVVHGKSMAGIAALLAIVGVVGSIRLGRAAMLSNWDPTYPIVVGNMPDGQSPWQGRIREIGISSKAMAGDEGHVFSDGFASVAGKNLVALYKPGGTAEAQDISGISPPLVWKPHKVDAQGTEATFSLNGPSLESSSAAAAVAERIRETNQFSVFADFDPEPAFQPGVLPIVGMCRDEDHCNFLMAHYYLSLVFRVRTPVTGDSAERSDYHQRQILSNGGEHRVLVSYDGASLRLFADGAEAGPSMELGPGPELFRYFHRIGQYQEVGYKILYYALIFGPLGLLIWLQRLGGKTIRWPLVASGVILVAIALELSLTLTCRRPFSSMNIVLAIAWFAAGYAFFAATVPLAAERN